MEWLELDDEYKFWVPIFWMHLDDEAPDRVLGSTCSERKQSRKAVKLSLNERTYFPTRKIMPF